MCDLTVDLSVNRELSKLVYLPCLHPTLLLPHWLSHRLWLPGTFPSEMPPLHCLAGQLMTRQEGPPLLEQPVSWHATQPVGCQRLAGGPADWWQSPGRPAPVHEEQVWWEWPLQMGEQWGSPLRPWVGPDMTLCHPEPAHPLQHPERTIVWEQG